MNWLRFVYQILDGMEKTSMSWRRSLMRNFVLILEKDLGCYRSGQARRGKKVGRQEEGKAKNKTEPCAQNCTFS